MVKQMQALLRAKIKELKITFKYTGRKKKVIFCRVTPAIAPASVMYKKLEIKIIASGK